MFLIKSLKNSSSKETETYPDIKGRTQNIQYQKTTPPWHIIIKTLNIQNGEKILKVSRGKYQIKNKCRYIRITSDFSMETLKAIRPRWIFHNNLRTWFQPRLLHAEKLYFTLNRKQKLFHNKNKVKKFWPTNLALQNSLEEKLESEEKLNYIQEDIKSE